MVFLVALHLLVAPEFEFEYWPYLSRILFFLLFPIDFNNRLVDGSFVVLSVQFFACCSILWLIAFRFVALDSVKVLCCEIQNAYLTANY